MSAHDQINERGTCKESFQVGDTVRVWLNGRAFVGQVHQVHPNYNWTDSTWMEVHGNSPEPFVTTARCANAEAVN